MLNSEIFLDLIYNLSEININIVDNKIVCNDNKHEFELNYFNSEEDERNIDGISFTTEFNINSKDFFSVIKMFEKFDDCIIYNVGNNLFLSIQNDFLKTKSVLISEQILQTDSKANYSLKYLNNMSYLKDVFDTIKLSYGDNLMCKLEGNKEECEFSFYLAPRSL